MIARSKNDVPIRLTEERWLHIIGEHAELEDFRSEVLEAIRAPERVLSGIKGELFAVRSQPDGKVLVAVYRELVDDGFVITAFLTRRVAYLIRKIQLWPALKSRTS